MIAPACLGVEELEPFALAQIDARRRSEIETHLSSCAPCGRLLAAVRSNLELAALLVPEAAPAEVVAPEGYRLAGRIGRGGMGTVHEALQLRTGRRVALKVLHVAAPEPERRERLFRRELRALARLRHPGIASVLDAGHCPDGRPFLALELVTGPELLEHLERRGAGRAERLLALEAIARAIAHAHQRGVIHRDLKPSNVRVDERGEPKVLDFGLAQLLEIEEEGEEDGALLTFSTRSPRIQGTLPYMSPEQVGGDPGAIDVRSDVYALGVLGYEMLLGRLPYETNWRHFASAVHAICDTAPARPRSLERRFPSELETILLEALEKEPARRYQTAAELADDLARLRTGAPILARRPSLPYQLRKLVGRHKLSAALAGTLSAAVLAAAVWLGALYARADALRVEAESGRARAEERRGDLKAAMGWLDGMLSATDPLGAFGTEVRVVEVLQESERALDAGELAERPGVESAVRRSLGRSFLALGRLAEAERHLLAAHHWIEGDEEASELERAGIEQELGNLRYKQGRYEEALAAHRSSLAAMLRTLPEGDARLVDAQILFAIDLRQLGRADEALAAFDAAQASLAAGGGGEQKRAQILVERAEVERHRGWGGEAEEQLREAVGLYESLFGERHLLTAMARYTYSGLLHARGGDWARIEALARDAVSVFRERLPQAHPNIGAGLLLLATLHADRGNVEQAERYYLEAIDIVRAAHPDGHPRLGVILRSLGFLRLRRGDLEGAGTALDEALEIHARLLPEQHPELVQTMYRVGVLRAEQGRLDEAGDIARDVAELLGSPARDPILLAAAMTLSSRVEWRRGRNAEAVDLAEEAVAILRAAPPTSSLAAGLVFLGDRLRDLGELDRAREAYSEALERMLQQFGPDSPSAQEVRSRLADVTAASGTAGEGSPALK